MSTAEESVTLDNGGFTALELNSRTINNKNSFLKKNGTRWALRHTHTHTYTYLPGVVSVIGFFVDVAFIVCVSPGLLPGPVQVVFTTLTRTSVTTITERR